MAFRYCIGPRLDDGWATAQPAVVMILKHLRNGAMALSLIRQTGRSQESNQGPPGLQGICYRRRNSLVCGSTGRMGLCFFCGFMSRSTRRLSGSGSGFKASQETGQRLKSHPTDWEKPGIEPATPDLQDIALSET